LDFIHRVIPVSLAVKARLYHSKVFCYKSSHSILVKIGPNAVRVVHVVVVQVATGVDVEAVSIVVVEVRRRQSPLEGGKIVW